MHAIPVRLSLAVLSAGSIALDWYYLSRVRTMTELSGIIDSLTADSINTYLAAHRPQLAIGAREHRGRCRHAGDELVQGRLAHELDIRSRSSLTLCTP